MLADDLERLDDALKGVYRLALGGTAVGTGINAPPGFAEAAAAEIAKLTEYGRIELRCSVDVFFDHLENNPRLDVLPLTPRIALESTRLGSAFPRDPSDQLIAATARVHGLRLATADDRIRRSGVVTVI